MTRTAMDIDMYEETAQPSSSAVPIARSKFTVPVDDSHPFDLDSYITNYCGRSAIDRLVHIISVCPSLAPDAFRLAVSCVQQSRDPSLYQSVLTAYEQTCSLPDTNLPLAQDIATLDTEWADQMISKNQVEKSKLEVELRTYTNNMIKESIRMAHRDLGHFYRSTGDYSLAYKHYTKSREYCTTSQHILDMCLSVLELLIEQRNFSHIPTYVYKAEAAVEAVIAANNVANEKSSATPASGVAFTATTSSHRSKASAEREKIQSKLDLASALSFLGQSNYEKAAYHFVRIGPSKYLDDWLGKVLSPGDIAIYGTLCALSSYTRGAIKAQVIQNDTFGVYLEQEPYIRELIEAYMTSNFKAVLELLSRYSTRHYLDIHLASHIKNITNQIRDWAVVLYFQPFSSIKLERMSQAFGWTVDEVERHVIASIQSGAIKGRIDKQNQVLQAIVEDPRVELLNRALQAGASLKNANRKLLLRMRLQQADIVIKAPSKGSSRSTEMVVGD